MEEAAALQATPLLSGEEQSASTESLEASTTAASNGVPHTHDTVDTLEEESTPALGESAWRDRAGLPFGSSVMTREDFSPEAGSPYISPGSVSGPFVDSGFSSNHLSEFSAVPNSTALNVSASTESIKEASDQDPRGQHPSESLIETASLASRTFEASQREVSDSTSLCIPKQAVAHRSATGDDLHDPPVEHQASFPSSALEETHPELQTSTRDGHVSVVHDRSLGMPSDNSGPVRDWHVPGTSAHVDACLDRGENLLVNQDISRDLHRRSGGQSSSSSSRPSQAFLGDSGSAMPTLAAAHAEFSGSESAAHHVEMAFSENTVALRTPRNTIHVFTVLRGQGRPVGTRSIVSIPRCLRELMRRLRHYLALHTSVLPGVHLLFEELQNFPLQITPAIFESCIGLYLMLNSAMHWRLGALEYLERGKGFLFSPLLILCGF